MSEKCVHPIIVKNDFKYCLMNYNWSPLNTNVNINEIGDGYIEIGSFEIIQNPTSKSIKVFIYHQWAADGEGKLYLLSQLG